MRLIRDDFLGHTIALDRIWVPNKVEKRWMEKEKKYDGLKTLDRRLEAKKRENKSILGGGEKLSFFIGHYTHTLDS